MGIQDAGLWALPHQQRIADLFRLILAGVHILQYRRSVGLLLLVLLLLQSVDVVEVCCWALGSEV